MHQRLPPAPSRKPIRNKHLFHISMQCAPDGEETAKARFFLWGALLLQGCRYKEAHAYFCVHSPVSEGQARQPCEKHGEVFIMANHAKIKIGNEDRPALRDQLEQTGVEVSIPPLPADACRRLPAASRARSSLRSHSGKGAYECRSAKRSCIWSIVLHLKSCRPNGCARAVSVF